MSWTDQYKQKVVTAAEAVKAVKSGDRIFLTGNCSVPLCQKKSCLPW